MKGSDSLATWHTDWAVTTGCYAMKSALILWREDGHKNVNASPPLDWGKQWTVERIIKVVASTCTGGDYRADMLNRLQGAVSADKLQERGAGDKLGGGSVLLVANRSFASTLRWGEVVALHGHCWLAASMAIARPARSWASISEKSHACWGLHALQSWCLPMRRTPQTRSTASPLLLLPGTGLATVSLPPSPLPAASAFSACSVLLTNISGPSSFPLPSSVPRWTIALL